MKVFIYPNFEKTHSRSCTESACKILASLGCEILMPEAKKRDFSFDGVIFCDVAEAVSSCDLMISVGGDGTILKCAKLAARQGKKLLGINCGRLGFMATLERTELSLLERLISGDYRTDERMMLEAEITYSDGRKESHLALNEAVLSGGYGTIRDFTVLADGITVSSLRADGLIFSTPTGASAYSLSAGGPLIEPSLDCIEFTQICPHSLFARSMLFSPETELEVRYKADGSAASLSVDGQKPIILNENDRLIIRQAEQRLMLIDIRGGSYFRAVNSKLMQPAKPAEND